MFTSFSAAREGLLISVTVRSVGSSAADEKSHTSNNAKSATPTPNFNRTGAPDGEKNPSIMPAITSMGMMPATSRTASRPANVMESRRL